MASVPGTNVAAPVVPFDDADTYPTHDALYGVGGWREVKTVAERNAIPAARRRVGMVVTVTDDPTPANNKKWELYASGSWGQFGDPPPRPTPRTVTTATTLNADDIAAGGLFVNSSAQVNVVVPSGLPPGPVAVVQVGAGPAEAVEGVGVTISVRAGKLKRTSGIRTVMQLLPSSGTAWTAFGDLADVGVPVTLPNITVTPTTATYTVGGSGVLATLSAVPSGATRTFSPDDGRWVFNGSKTQILTGGTPAAEGSYTLTITDTHPTAVNSPRTATLGITVNPVTVPVTLDPIVISPNTASQFVGASGTLAAILTPVHMGATRSISPGDGRWVLASDKMSIVTGGTAVTAGTYTVTVTDTLAGATNTPQTATLTVTVSAPPVEKNLVTLAVLGTGAAAGTVLTFGQALQEGDLMPGNSLTMRAGATVYPTSWDNVGSLWPDGSVRHAAVHVALPALTDGSNTALSLWRDGSAPGAPINMTTALAGRTCVVEVKNGANVFTFDCIASLSGNRWYNGARAAQTRLKANIPRAAVGGNTNATLVVDLTVYSDGTIDADVKVWNYRTWETGQGTAVYDLKLTGDGVVQFTQAGVSAPLYTGWGQRRRWAAAGATRAVDPAFVKPPVSYLARTGTVANYNTSDSPGETVLAGFASSMAAGSWNTPYTSRELREDMGPGGDHPSIGETTFGAATWLITGDPRAARYAMGQAEAYATVPWHCWDQTHDSWANPIDRPYGRTSTHDSEFIGSAQTLWSIDTGHMGDPVWVPYLLTARRSLLDSVLGQGSYSVMEKAPAGFERGDVTRGNTVSDADTPTGRTARKASIASTAEGVILNRGVQVRTAAWSTRQVVDAAIAPASEQPHGDYFAVVLAANFARMNGMRAALQTAQGEFYGASAEWIYGSYNGLGAPWQMDMQASAIIRAARMKVAGALDYLTWAQNWFAGRLLNHTGWVGADGTQYNLKFGTGGITEDPTNPAVWVDSWAQLMTGGVTYGDNYSSGAWVTTVGDYERRSRAVMNQYFDLFADRAVSTTLLQQALDKIAAWPGIKTFCDPDSSRADPRTNIVQLNPLPVVVPVITAGQSFSGLTTAATAGTVVGTIATTGGVPTSWSFQSGNTGTAFSVTSGGQLAVANTLTAGTYTLGMRATNSAGNSTTVNVSVVIATSIIAPVPTAFTGTISAGASVGDLIGTMAYTGGTPTAWSITAGNTGTVVAINATTGALTVAAALTAGSRSLTIQATNSAGSNTTTANITIEAVAPTGPIYGLSAGTTIVSQYGLRRTVHGYSGPLIRVRRTDNTEQDIGMDGSGNLDTTALTTFVGAARGYVTRWYDQSGAARNLLQTNTAKQPYITSAGGAVLTKTGKTRPNIHCAASRGFTSASMSGLGAAGVEMGAVMAIELKSTTPNYGRVAAFLANGQSDDEAASQSMNIAAYANAKFFAAVAGYYAETNAVAINTPYIHTSAYESGTPGRSRLNGTANDVGAATNYLDFADAGTLWVGLSNSGEAAGADIYVSEFVFFRNFADSDIPLIENSMKTFEGIA